MAIEVILMQDVADLGSEGEVVRVSEGYARNFLMPRKMAAPVTEATRRRLAKVRADREVARLKKLEELKAIAAKLEGVSVTISARSSGEDKLYGSVTAADIAGALKTARNIIVDAEQIQLENPIKELGVFTVPVKLTGELQPAIKVWVVQE